MAFLSKYVLLSDTVQGCLLTVTLKPGPNTVTIGGHVCTKNEQLQNLSHFLHPFVSAFGTGLALPLSLSLQFDSKKAHACTGRAWQSTLILCLP